MGVFAKRRKNKRVDGGYGSGICGGEETRCGVRDDKRFGIDERKERKRSFYNAEKRV